MRIDKLSLAALEATLALYRDPERALRRAARAADARPRTRGRAPSGSPRSWAARSSRRRRRSAAGALPLLELPGPVVALGRDRGSPDELAARLRAADPPVVGRIQDGRLLLDPRTLADDELELVACALR